MHAQDMIRTHPRQNTMPVDQEALRECIEACFDCDLTCTMCADACLGEDMVAELVACIRLNLDCADVCSATGHLLSRQTTPNWDVLRAQLEACVAACQACAAECEKHAGMHEHCRVCAEACRRCEEACRSLLA